MSLLFLSGKARFGCQASTLHAPPQNFLGQGRAFQLQQSLGAGRDNRVCAGFILSLHFALSVAGVYSGPTLHFELEIGQTRGTDPPSLFPALRVPACTHNGKTYSHGEVWHPTVLSFGPMPCILCTCVDGYQDCHRVNCPTQYPCSQPKKVAGKCCKICPGRRDAEGRRRHCS